jgi:hypothetical protein
LVLLGECAVLLHGGLQAGVEGGVGGSLTGRDRQGGRAPGRFAETFDLGSEVGLAVEPGSRDTGSAGDGLEG